MYIYLVDVKDTVTEWRMVESVHLTREGAEEALQERREFWNSNRYSVSIQTYKAAD